jgi:hypothetical protein
MPLYHASTEKNLSIIKPQRTLSHDTYIGDYVFAASNKAYAAMYLAPKGMPQLLNAFDGKPYLVINGNIATFRDKDAGGAIYEVPSDTFNGTPQVELAETELVSTQSVVPLNKEVFNTALGAFNNMNIPIYFVDNTVYEKIKQAEDHGFAILQNLEPHEYISQ